MLPRSGAVYSRVCGWERVSSCLWDFYSETTVVERRSRGVAAGMTSNVLSISSFIDTARRITQIYFCFQPFGVGVMTDTCGPDCLFLNIAFF